MLGNVDLLGLNSFGNPVGLNPIWGTLIGGGVAGVTQMTVKHTASGNVQMNSDLIGLGAGVATAGLMLSMKGTRHAAWGALLGAFLVSGLSWLERVLLGTVALPTATAQVASQVAAASGGGGGAMSGLGIARTRQLGLSTTRQLGISTTAQVPHARGTIPGVAGLRLGNGQPPVSLMGQRSAGAAQVALMGGPQVHGVAGHWGATHFSR